MKRARFTEEQIIGVLERDLVRLKHTGVFEVVCAFSRREAVEQRADGSAVSEQTLGLSRLC
jgi:hypothetical protein